MPIVDAVTAADGFTYEREALVRWVREHGTSPQTRQPLDVSLLLSDHDVGAGHGDVAVAVAVAVAAGTASGRCVRSFTFFSQTPL